MIQNILELLPYVKDGSENIRIAKGQNYLPKNLKQAFTQVKNEIKMAVKKTIIIDANTDSAEKKH